MQHRSGRSQQISSFNPKINVTTLDATSKIHQSFSRIRNYPQETHRVNAAKPNQQPNTHFYRWVGTF
jgi:hypothetical protein